MCETMHLAINSSVLVTPHTGIAVYAREIVNRLPLLDPSLEFSHFVGTHWQVGELDIPQDGGGGAKGLIGALKVKERVKLLPGAREAWHQFKKYRFEAGQKEIKADVLWEPCYIPPGRMEPMVISVHDLSHIRYPQFHPKSRLKWMEALPRTLERADKILTVSEFSKREIIEVFGTLAEKIVVAYNAVADQHKFLSKEQRGPVLHKFGLKDKSYFLSVCTLEPRKNLETLLKAYNLVPKSIQEMCPLVLVGGKGWGKEGHNSFYEKLCPGGNLVFTGYVPTADLPALYAGAQCFAYPALYEGFGIPPIEAMVCGSPVIVADIPVLNEVCADAAFYAPPLDEQHWRDRLLECLDLNQEQYQARCELGFNRAKFFSWDKTARQVYDVLNDVANV